MHTERYISLFKSFAFIHTHTHTHTSKQYLFTKNQDSGVQQQGLRQHLAYIFMSCLRGSRRPEPELLWQPHTPRHVLLAKRGYSS